MKTARIVLLFIIVTAVLVGGYFGANMYMQNMAIKKINKTIKENHWENLVEYGKVKASLLSGSVTIQDVKFTLQNNLNSQTIGILNLRKVVVKGDLDKNYNISGYNIDFVNLNSKLPENLVNKPLLNAKLFSFKVHKNKGIVDKMKGKIEDIAISKNIIDMLKSSNDAKFEEFTKVVKINNPINVEMNYDASIGKGTLNIKKYSIDFVNNIGIAYKAKIKNVDFKGLEEASKEIKKNPKNFMVLANVMGKLMQFKITNFEFEIKNYGLIDRFLSVAAKKKNKTKQALIDEILIKAKTIPIKSAYPAIQNFIKSKSKKLVVEIDNKKDLSIGDILSETKNKANILNIVKIKFSN